MDMTALDDLRAFNLHEAHIVLWVFRGPRGASTELPSYPGKWVQTNQEVSLRLKEAFSNERGRIEETMEYSLLAENNEASALRIGADETHAGIILRSASEEIEQKRAKSEVDILNSSFYAIKAVHGETVIYAVRQTDKSWKSQHRKSLRSTFVMREHELTVDDTPRFDIHDGVNFFVVGGDVLVSGKRQFESILRYKAAHISDFDNLKAEVEFCSIFADINPLDAHIRNNKIQLRRAQAIHQKGHYKDGEFMRRLRENYADYGFNINFNDLGLIVPTPETCSEIMTALIDHRLSSVFSEKIYDVQNTTTVAI
jgi:hypothetical protein